MKTFSKTLALVVLMASAASVQAMTDAEKAAEAARKAAGEQTGWFSGAWSSVKSAPGNIWRYSSQSVRNTWNSTIHGEYSEFDAEGNVTGAPKKHENRILNYHTLGFVAGVATVSGVTYLVYKNRTAAKDKLKSWLDKIRGKKSVSVNEDNAV